MSIALSIGNNLTTNGVFTSSAVNNTSVTNVTDFASVASSGTLKLLSTQTASSSATIDFTSGIDSTYDSYVFKFINIHPSTDGDGSLTFQANASGGSGFNETITASYFRAYHTESDGTATLLYDASKDQKQGTSYQILSANIGGNNDECASGTLEIFNPSSTVYIKNFICNASTYHSNSAARHDFTAGYFNITSAIDEISFKMDVGNIDSGTIKMYGVV